VNFDPEFQWENRKSRTDEILFNRRRLQMQTHKSRTEEPLRRSISGRPNARGLGFWLLDGC